MSAKKIMAQGHAIDDDRNVMTFALSCALDGSAHPYVLEVNQMPWTMSIDEASRLASAAVMVARALGLPRRDGRRLREATAFAAAPPGPDGSAWPVALGISDRGDDSVMFFSFGHDCVRFPAGEGADALLGLFASLAEDVADVERVTGPQRVQQSQVDLSTYRSPFVAAYLRKKLPWETE